MNDKVTSINIRSKKPAQMMDDVVLAKWSVAELGKASKTQWIKDAMGKTQNPGDAMSLWAHYPNLKKSTEKLASFITPSWPSSGEESLLTRAIDAGISNVQTALAQDDIFAPRIVGLYLHGLVSCAAEVAMTRITGVGENESLHEWECFSMPLDAWAIDHQIEEIVAYKAAQLVSDEEILGVRKHILTSISTTKDTGYFEAYAPPFVIRRMAHAVSN
jgi:hypothetical protein